MNKIDFVNYVATKNDLTKVDAKTMVDTVIDSITSALENGDDISLSGFGKFEVIDVPTRDARNPRTGETIQVPAHKKPSFKFSNTIKELVH